MCLSDFKPNKSSHLQFFFRSLPSGTRRQAQEPPERVLFGVKSTSIKKIRTIRANKSQKMRVPVPTHVYSSTNAAFSDDKRTRFFWPLLSGLKPQIRAGREGFTVRLLLCSGFYLEGRGRRGVTRKINLWGMGWCWGREGAVTGSWGHIEQR